MGHLVGLGKKMMVTSMGSFASGGCRYDWAASPFLWLLAVFISKEKPRTSQQSPLELCDRQEDSPPGWTAARDPPASQPTLGPGFRTLSCNTERAFIFVQLSLNELSCEKTDA